MSEIKEGVEVIQGAFNASQKRIGIVASRFNSFIVEHLLSGALDTLRRHGIDQKSICIIKAPGAFELPLVVKKLVRTNKFDGVIALGAVIRGATPHFDYVAGECTKGLAQVGLEFEVPVAFGVLTTDSIEQAIERAGTKAGNKGAEAALSLLEMVSLMQQLNNL